jgi:hypothetical protein
MTKEKVTATLPPAQPEAGTKEAAQPLQCRTVSPRKAFIRCGVKWTSEWQDVPASFTPGQIARLKADKMLRVK